MKHALACRYDLGNLLFKMKQLDKAERVLLEAVERVGGGRPGAGEAATVGHVELATLIEGARSMALLARIYEELGRTPDAIRMLKDARELQGRCDDESQCFEFGWLSYSYTELRVCDLLYSNDCFFAEC